MSYNATNCQNTQPAAAAFTTDQVAALNQMFGSLQQQQQQQQQLPAGVPFPAHKTLTTADIGKIIVNKNGAAKVAQRDALNPGQLGKWQITVKSVFQAPQPTVITLQFTGDPSNDDIIRFAWTIFTFKTAATGGNDIAITPGDIPAQMQAVVNALSGNYTSYWTATSDGKNTVKITFNPQWAVFRVDPSQSNGVLVPPVSQGDNFDTKISNVSVNVYNSGSTGDYDSLGDSFLDGVNFGLAYNEIFNSDNFPGQLTQFSAVFPATVNEFASAIALAYNKKFSNVASAVVAENVITISQLALQTVPLGQGSGNNSKYNYLVPILSGSNYADMTTITQSITPNFAFINDPVLGVLTGLQNGTAYIADTYLQRVKLSGNNNVTITPFDNTLNLQLLVSRLCLINNDGTVESLGSVDYLKNQFGLNPDIKTILQFFSPNCIYWALSGGNVGDTIMVTSIIPISFFMAVALEVVDSTGLPSFT